MAGKRNRALLTVGYVSFTCSEENGRRKLQNNDRRGLQPKSSDPSESELRSRPKRTTNFANYATNDSWHIAQMP